MKIGILALLVALTLSLGACKEKKVSRTIKTVIEPIVERKDTTAMPDREDVESFLLDGTSYNVLISRKADKNLRLVTDNDGNKYYDNAINILIDNQSGKLLDHTFHKSYFDSFLHSSDLKYDKCVLWNIVFNDVEDDRAVFIASVGSPDEMDDEYVLIEIKVNKRGEISLAKKEDLE